MNKARRAFLQSALDNAVRHATKDKEIIELAGLDEPCPYQEVIDQLNNTLDRLRELRDHTHEWITTDDERQSYCCICGRSGDI